MLDRTGEFRGRTAIADWDVWCRELPLDRFPLKTKIMGSHFNITSRARIDGLEWGVDMEGDK